MSDFTVKPQKIKNNSEEMKLFSKSIRSTEKMLSRIVSNLAIKGEDSQALKK